MAPCWDFGATSPQRCGFFGWLVSSLKENLLQPCGSTTAFWTSPQSRFFLGGGRMIFAASHSPYPWDDEGIPFILPDPSWKSCWDTSASPQPFFPTAQAQSNPPHSTKRGFRATTALQAFIYGILGDTMGLDRQKGPHIPRSGAARHPQGCVWAHSYLPTYDTHHISI